MADRHTRIRGKQILADTVDPSDLNATNSASDGQVPSYSVSTQEFTWVTRQGLFEIDENGSLMPVTATNTDEYYELDGNSDIQPKTA